MEQDDQRIMAGTDFNAAVGQQALGVALRDVKLDKALQGDQREDGEICPHRGYCSMVRKPAVKPGPKADTKRRPLKFSFRPSFRTNRTVGADILP